ECLNNLKQLGIASHGYDSRNRSLPGYANEIAKASGTGTGRLANWVVTLLPDMDRNDLWSRWNDPNVNPTPLVTNYMQLLVCASDPPDTQEDSWLAYVANCGLPDCVAVGG